MSVLEQKLLQDPFLTWAQKQILLNAIRGLDGSNKLKLTNTLKNTVGAGVGFMIAKFLLTLNLPLALGAALMGFFISDANKGQEKNLDIFKRPYTLV